MADLPEHNPAAPPAEPEIKKPDAATIVQVLASYRAEAINVRDGGENPRTLIWKNNWDRYWGRYDHSKKADWQSKHVLPEVPQYVDRWASAIREALDASPEWFTVNMEAGNTLEPLIPHITKAMRVILGRCARTPDGHVASFSSLFEEQMKLGAMMASCAAVTWKGYTAVETVDPRECWFDAKMRGRYRLRHYEIDKDELLAMASKTDEFGLPIYNKEQIESLTATCDEFSETNRQVSTGTGPVAPSIGRVNIQIDEWRATVLQPGTDEVIADRALMVVANKQHLIRGPEVNPYNHNKDWIVFTPMVTVPLSIYGRTYMEDWSDTADAFIEMTNLILDGAQSSAMKAFVMQAEMLLDPTQAAEGVHPNVVFQLAEGMPVADFMKEIPLGQLDEAAVTVWQALKNELREGAKLSEIALGQMPDKTHIAAEGISQSAQAGSSMIRSMAKTIEQRFLEPLLTLVWETSLQYMDFLELAPEIGEDAARMLQAQRQEFANKKITFRVRGISGLIDRQQRLQNLLTMLQTISQNPQLLQAFMQKTNLPRLLQSLQTYFNVDPASFEYTETEKKLMALQQQAAGVVPGPAPQMPADAPAQPQGGKQ